MIRILTATCFILLIIIWSASAVAVVAQVTQLPPAPTWFEHVDLMQLTIVGLFTLVLWFCIRTLRKIDANQTNLFLKFEAHERRLSRMEGAHEARTGIRLSCSVEE